jgi:hypothetical protein
MTLGLSGAGLEGRTLREADRGSAPCSSLLYGKTSPLSTAGPWASPP